MPETKMSAEEMARYYIRVHHEVLARDAHNPLGAVIASDASYLANCFTDFAHRLGMKRAFEFLKSQWGSLAKRSVLDLGCGRGRWSKEYAQRGANVTGVDISPDAIRVLADEMPQHRFLCEDIAALKFPHESFDVVNSVTVLQHMPQWKQQTALKLLSCWVKRGGYVVLLENVLAFDAPHVFPHETNGWIGMVEANGFKCIYCHGSNFEILFRVEARLLKLLRGLRLPATTTGPSMSRTGTFSITQRVKSAITSALAGVSFPVEWVCQRIPLAKPTHSVMIFVKQA